MSKTQNSNVQSARPKRVPVGQRNRINIRNKDPNYVYRVVNDIDDNVSVRQEQGYEIVPLDSAGVVGDRRVDNPSTLGSSTHFSVGQGTMAVLMRIPREHYEEDQASKQEQLDEIDNQIVKKADYGQVRLTK